MAKQSLSRCAGLALVLSAEPGVAERPTTTAPADEPKSRDRGVIESLDDEKDVLKQTPPSKESGKAVNEAIAAFGKQVTNDHMFATKVYNYLVQRGIVKNFKPKDAKEQSGLWPTSGGKYITKAVYTSEKAAVEALGNILRSSWDDEMAKKLHDLGLKYQFQEAVTKAEPGRRKTVTHEPGRGIAVTDMKDLANQLVNTLQDKNQLLRSVKINNDNIAQLVKALKEERRHATVNKKRFLVDRADAALNSLREMFPEMTA
jgi:hypothetical protein